MQIRNCLQQQIDHHAVAHGFVQSHFDLRHKGKIRLTQAFIPGNGNPGFTGKRSRIIAGFARLFEKRDAVAIIRVNVFGKLLAFQRCPGAVRVKTQMQIRNCLQQQIHHHAVAHGFVQSHFDLRHFLARHIGKFEDQIVRIAITQRRRTVIGRLRERLCQLRQCTTYAKGNGRHLRYLAIACQPVIYPGKQHTLRIFPGFLTEARQWGDLPPPFALALTQANIQPVAGF